MDDKHNDKEIMALVKLNIDFLAKFIIKLKKKPDITIKQFFNEWQNSVGVSDYSLINQGVILTSLYGLIVYPQQKFIKSIPRHRLDKFDLGDVDIMIWTDNDKRLDNFIRHLRNSLSHARITINNEKPEFIFEDKLPGSEDLNFKVRMNMEQLQKLIMVIGKSCLKPHVD